jgi:hypothetical protein
VPAQIARDGVLLDTFVLERKHKFLKHSGTIRFRTADCCRLPETSRDYEMSVLSRAFPGFAAGALQSRCRDCEWKGHSCLDQVLHGSISHQKLVANMWCSIQECNIEDWWCCYMLLS